MSIRLHARSLGLVAVFLTVAVACPGLARAGVDFWDIDNARADLTETSAEARELAVRDDSVMRRIAIKEELITDLIAGRASLADVSARFLELNADEPGYLDVLCATVPGDSDAERAARNVIDYTGPRISSPAARADLRIRLEAELAHMQDANHSGAR